eukprot:g29865.t1
MFGALDSGEGEDKWVGVTPSSVTGEGAVGLWGGVEGEGSVDQGVLEGTVPAEGGQRRGGEYVSGDGISLEVAEMASDDLLDVNAGGMVGKDKGNPIAVAGGKSAGDGSDPVEGPVNNGAGESSDLKKMRGVKREVVVGEDELGQAE